MKKIFLTLMVVSLAFIGCDSDDDNNELQTSNLTVNLDGLEDLGPDFVYEGWAIVDGLPVTTGVFNVDSAGVLSQTSFTIDADALANASKFVITIEPINDTDPLPSAQKLVAGDFANDSAALSTAVAPAVGNFTGSTGAFFLRTPTDESGDNNGNDENGVWFGIPGTPPAASLVLPELEEGWVYEGWVIGESGPLSTGTFTSFDMMDNNAGLATSFGGIENAGPPIPGEDFFNNAPAGETFPLDLRGRTVVISVEPVPDNSAAPFLLKPLVGMAGQETAPTTYDFGFNAASLPTGTVTR